MKNFLDWTVIEENESVLYTSGGGFPLLSHEVGIHPTHSTGIEAPQFSTLLQLYLKHIRFQFPMSFANFTYPELFTALHRLRILCQRGRATSYETQEELPSALPSASHRKRKP